MRTIFVKLASSVALAGKACQRMRARHSQTRRVKYASRRTRLKPNSHRHAARTAHVAIVYQADEAAQHTASLAVITYALTMRDMNRRCESLQELWFKRAISRICGAWIEN
ncbi:uncharacterized protein SCHCODRAFT_02110154 [Schizophyllum commune H4-8]|uniref:uncharacterized protein n=1 Tax=Schizophyllum commune (strain H4-8 / FGSC 9210) TaxID=578458 RepID=UPI00215F9085|nr:uncharacterized protein SCHCODRAFT_02110154 [Schizophyllum commune H4-8]KAI5885993.1 hypothetical protein SCHCODRAFT_02110154 [Schizophyllum commune H4-8]